MIFCSIDSLLDDQKRLAHSPDISLNAQNLVREQLSRAAKDKRERQHVYEISELDQRFHRCKSWPTATQLEI